MPVQYSQELIDHYKNPRNRGELENADVSATVGNAVCGDVITMFLKFKQDHITDVSFQTYGCGPCIALSSMVTEKVKGMKTNEAYKVNIEEFLERFPDIPQNKRHCTNLVIVALRKAIDMYRQEKLGKEETK